MVILSVQSFHKLMGGINTQSFVTENDAEKFCYCSLWKTWTQKSRDKQKLSNILPPVASFLNSFSHSENTSDYLKKHEPESQSRKRMMKAVFISRA